jgi:hypothetical protein
MAFRVLRGFQTRVQTLLTAALRVTIILLDLGLYTAAGLGARVHKTAVPVRQVVSQFLAGVAVAQAGLLLLAIQLLNPVLVVTLTDTHQVAVAALRERLVLRQLLAQQCQTEYLRFLEKVAVAVGQALQQPQLLAQQAAQVAVAVAVAARQEMDLIVERAAAAGAVSYQYGELSNESAHH